MGGGPAAVAMRRSGHGRPSRGGGAAASITSVADCPKPVVAAVHGYCIGGGVDLITACDVRLASADAVFSVRETKVAIVADLGSLQRLPRIIGAGHVAELAFTGKDIDAARARAIGLVNDVYAAGPTECWRPGGRWPGRSPPTRRSPCRGPRRCWPPTTAGPWPRASSTWPPGTPGCWPPTT